MTGGAVVVVPVRLRVKVEVSGLVTSPVYVLLLGLSVLLLGISVSFLGISVLADDACSDVTYDVDNVVKDAKVVASAEQTES